MPRMAQSGASLPRRVASTSQHGARRRDDAAIIDRFRKPQPASSGARPRSDSRTDLAARLRLSYDAFGILAALSDVCAILVASMVTGTAYQWLAFGHVGSIVECFGVGAI